MPRSAEKRQRRGFWQDLEELSMFFQGKDEVHKSMRRVARRLKNKKIPYAVMGGMAVVAHGHRRATNDVDILLTVDGFEQFRRHFVPKNYEPVPKRARTFVDRVNKVALDVLLTGRFPGSGKPGPIAFPDPESATEDISKINVIDLTTLIQLKLAARRYQDFADVVNLIRVHELDDSFRDLLHSSLHADYIECLEEKRREDEYQAREARQERNT